MLDLLKGNLSKVWGRETDHTMEDSISDYALYAEGKLTLASSTSSGLAWRWLIANKMSCTASDVLISPVLNRFSRNLRILASLTSTTRSKNQFLMDKENKMN